MRRIGLCVSLVLFATLLALRASNDPAPKQGGDLYVIGYAMNQSGPVGKWTSVGQGAWGSVLAATAIKKRIYTIESDDTLQKTNPATGKRTPIGKPDFKDITFLNATSQMLYAIKANGNLFRVDPNTGAMSQLGADEAWKNVRAASTLREHLYTVETDGSLQQTDLATGKRTPIGKPNFDNTAFLFGAIDKLYIVTKQGDLLRVSLSDGSSKQVGEAGAWKTVHAGTILGGQLYTAETADVDSTTGFTKVWVTDLTTGKRKKFLNKEFGDTDHVLVAGGAVYTIENSGNLSKVSSEQSKNDRDGLNEWNCFPLDFEKVFREQSHPLFRKVHTRLIMGTQLTREGMMEGFQWARQRATKSDMLVWYITTHGDQNPQDGWYFSDAEGGIVTTRDIKKELAQFPCPVIAMIESCHSGGFISHLEPMPDNVTALCGCLPEQTMDNEFDIALFEGLYGRADFNKNGVVDLGELMQYIPLRYKEDSCNGRSHLTPTLARAQAMSSSLPLTCVAPNLTAIVHNGIMWSALLEKQVGDDFHVHLLGWDTKPSPYFRTNRVSRGEICLSADGQPVLVKQDDGVWCPARLIAKKGDKYKVICMPSGEEELVSRHQIQYPFASDPDLAKKPAAGE